MQRQQQQQPREDKCVGPDQCSAHLCFDALLAAISGTHTTTKRNKEWMCVRLWGLCTFTHTRFKLQVEYFEICMSVSFAHKPTIKSINSFLSFLILFLFQQCANKMLLLRNAASTLPSPIANTRFAYLHRLSPALPQSRPFALTLIVFKCRFYVSHVSIYAS